MELVWGPLYSSIYVYIYYYMGYVRPDDFHRFLRKHLNGYIGLPAAAFTAIVYFPSWFWFVKRRARQYPNGYLSARACPWPLYCRRLRFPLDPRVLKRRAKRVAQRLPPNGYVSSRAGPPAVLPSCFPLGFRSVNRCARQLAGDYQHSGRGGGGGRETPRGAGGTSMHD